MHMNAMEHPIQRLFATIGDPSRFKVLHVLLEGDFCVSAIAARIGLSQSCTTRHLQVLQREGVAVRTRVGKKVIFRVADGPPEMARLIEWAMIKQHPPGTGSLAMAGTARSNPRGRGDAPKTRYEYPTVDTGVLGGASLLVDRGSTEYSTDPRLAGVPGNDLRAPAASAPVTGTAPPAGEAPVRDSSATTLPVAADPEPGTPRANTDLEDFLL
jgi:DNA-binding transcriptional ArsR family regulator